jgi:Protein of unknown function (DUF3298)
MRCPLRPNRLGVLTSALFVAALAAAGCTHPETPADAMVHLPAAATPLEPSAAEPSDAPRAWVEAVHHVTHDAADVELTYYRVHLPSAAASETISTHLHDWAMANVTSIERDAEDAASEDDTLPDRARFSLTITCEPNVVREALVSLRCFVSAYSGGAHASLVAETFNYAVDGDTARAVGLDDLFLDAKVGRAAVADACLADLRAQGALWVTAGNVTDVREMVDTFHFEPGKLVVTFAPYEVGPFAEGEHVVELPLSSLRGLRPSWGQRLHGGP